MAEGNNFYPVLNNGGNQSGDVSRFNRTYEPATVEDVHAPSTAVLPLDGSTHYTVGGQTVGANQSWSGAYSSSNTAQISQATQYPHSQFPPEVMRGIPNNSAIAHIPPHNGLNYGMPGFAQNGSVNGPFTFPHTSSQLGMGYQMFPPNPPHVLPTEMGGGPRFSHGNNEPQTMMSPAESFSSLTDVDGDPNDVPGIGRYSNDGINYSVMHASTSRSSIPNAPPLGQTGIGWPFVPLPAHAPVGHSSFDAPSVVPTHARFYCPPCGYRTERKGDWDRHCLTLKHGQERQYSCELCLRGFTRPDTLKRHMPTCPARGRRV